MRPLQGKLVLAAGTTNPFDIRQMTAAIHMLFGIVCAVKLLSAPEGM